MTTNRKSLYNQQYGVFARDRHYVAMGVDERCEQFGRLLGYYRREAA